MIDVDANLNLCHVYTSERVSPFMRSWPSVPGGGGGDNVSGILIFRGEGPHVQ